MEEFIKLKQEEKNDNDSYNTDNKSESSINIINFTYPAEKFYHIPITNTPNNEVIILTIPDYELKTFKHFIHDSEQEGEILESQKIIRKLTEYVKDYLKRNSDFTIEKRLQYAYEKMGNLSGNISIVLNMPDEFKVKPIIADYLKVFRDIRKNIKEKLNTDTFLTNPFAEKKFDDGLKTNFKKNHENKRVLTKWGTSFGDPEVLVKKEESEYYKAMREGNQDKKITLSYKQILETILVNHITDFRKEILIECILKNEEFQDNDFEKFVFYLENFILLFSGIQCKYFIDELGCLNMDFYSTEENSMTLAEIIHYQLQFKIMNNAEVLKYEDEKKIKNKNIKKEDEIKDEIKNEFINLKISNDKKKSNKKVSPKDNYNDITEALLSEINKRDENEDIDEEIVAKNKIQYEEIQNNEDVTLFPPFSNFTKRTAHFFRRYDYKDNYHMCEDCQNIKTAEESCNLYCSSVFRGIDKTRIIYAFLNNLININLIKNPDKNNIQFKSVFKFVLVLHEYAELTELTNYEKLVKTYLYPVEITEAKRLNKIFRNKFGEDLGFYFSWVSHYINWLIFPAILGLVLYTIGHFLSWMTDSLVYMYFNLFFAGVIMLWANFYLNSWKSREKFLCYIWGMDSFKLDKANQISDVPVDKYVFMGIKIPIIDYKSFLKRRLFSFCVIFVSLMVTITLNILIFYFENAQLYRDTNSDLNKISKGYWLYITPICTYTIREYMSGIYKNIALDLTNKEFHIHKDEFNSSLKLKIIFFEFFNYYFNLYYIAFVKRYFESCPMNDCYSALANQLTGILTSAIIVDLTKLFWNGIYQRNKTKEFENNLKENNPFVNNQSSKYIYYTRHEYEASDMTGEYLEIVLNYGYIIQFGASSPICFFIALLQTVFMRLMDAVKFSRLMYVRFISESHGIGVFHKVMRLMTFLGLITNVCIIFFSNNYIVHVDIAHKLFYLIVIENAVMIIMMLAGFKELPLWFTFKEKIEATYMRKYGSNIYNYNNIKPQEKEKLD